MGFLYPFVLWAAVAGVGPLILHFWRREQEKPPNLFPGVFFLVDPATPKPQRAQPLTWLLTALRTALILLLVLLAAGPYFHSRSNLELPERPVLLAFVIDDSPSMGLPASASAPTPSTTLTRLQRGLDEANRLIDALPAGSGIVWSTSSGRFHPLSILNGLATDRAAWHIACAPSDTAGDIGRAIDRVAQSAQEIPMPDRTVLLISDRTVGVALGVGPGASGANVREHVQTGLAKLSAAHITLAMLGLPPGAPAVTNPVTNPATNPATAPVTIPAPAPAPAAGKFVAPRLKIVSIERPPTWRTGRPVTFTVQVIFDARDAAAAVASVSPPVPPGPAAGELPASAAAERRVRKLTWQIGDAVHEQTDPMPAQSIDLPCGLRLQSFEWVERLPQAGWWKIEVTAEADATRLDRRTTFLPVRSPTPVWLVEPDASDAAGDSRYLALALDPLRQGSSSSAADAADGVDWAVARKSYADLRQGLPEDGVLVLWGAGRGLKRSDWDAIQQATARGMGLWLVGDGGAIPSARDHNLLFWNGEATGPAGVAVLQLAQPARLGLVPIRGMPENPICSALVATGPGVFEGAGVDQYYPVRPSQGTVFPLLAVEAGQDQLHPALLETTLGRGVGLLWTAPPLRGNGGLTDAALWPLITGLVLDRAAPTLGDWPDQPVGAVFNGEVGATAEPPFRLEQLADGAAVPGRFDAGAAWPAWRDAAHLVSRESRPLRHFFRDGRFHLMGNAANLQGIQVVRDSNDHVVGVQSVVVPAGEWDDTALDSGFFRASGGGLLPPGATNLPGTAVSMSQGQNDSVDAGSAVTTVPGGAGLEPVVGREVADAPAMLRLLQEQQATARPASGMTSVRGDLTPYLLLVLLGLLGAWLYLERREYSIVGP